VATRLAQRLVANFGLDSEVDIPGYAPQPSSRPDTETPNFEVHVDGLDSDWMSKEVEYDGWQPGDDAWHRIRAAGERLGGSPGRGRVWGGLAAGRLAWEARGTWS
jgi:hypothetical protein